MDKYRYRGTIYNLKSTHPHSVDVGLGGDVVAVPLADFQHQTLEVGYAGVSPYRCRAFIACPDWVKV